MKRHLLSLLTLLSLTIFVHAQNLDSIVNKESAAFLANGPRAGLAIGVIKNGSIARYYFGSTEINHKTTPDDASIFEIGSVTKTFTAQILANAVLEHRINLHDDIRKYLKGDYPGIEFQGVPVTVADLADWTSALPDNLPEDAGYAKAKTDVEQLIAVAKFHNSFTREQFFAELHKVKLNRAPGKNIQHSNTAAQLLGYILEDIYSLSYDQLLQKFITGRLKMSNTFVHVPTVKAANYVKGYNAQGILMPQIPADAASAGVLTSTLPDMLSYLKYQLAEKDSATRLTHQLHWGNMDSFGIGLNWFMKNNFDGERKIWTTGGTFGFATYIVYYPNRDFGIIALSNENDVTAEDGLNDLTQQIYNAIYFTAAERSRLAFGFSHNVNQLTNRLLTTGFDHAIEIVQQIRKQDAHFQLNEDELNTFGYSLLQKGEKQKALEIFKLNVALYPNSANTYDSLAETYATLGDKALAIKYYRQSLELNPGNTHAIDELKKLE